MSNSSTSGVVSPAKVGRKTQFPCRFSQFPTTPAFSFSLSWSLFLDGSVVVEPVLGDLAVSLRVCVDCEPVGDTLVVVLDASFILSIRAVVAAWKSGGRRDFLEFVDFRDDARSFFRELGMFDTNTDREGVEQKEATPSIFEPTTHIIIRTTPILTMERNRVGAEFSGNLIGSI